MTKFKDLDYMNSKISKPGWKTDTATRYIKWVKKSYDPEGLYVYDSYDNRLHERGYVILDDQLLESEGWEEYD